MDGHLAHVRFIPQYQRALKKALKRYLDAPPDLPEPNVEGLTPQDQLSALNRFWYELESSVKAVKAIEDSSDTIQGLWRSAISGPELGSSAADQYALDMDHFLQEHIYPTDTVMSEMEAKLKACQSRVTKEYRAIEAKMRETESSPVDNCETPATSKTRGRKTNLRDEPERPTVDFGGATTTPVMGESGETVIVNTALRKAFGDKTQQGEDHNTYVLLDENGQAVSNTQAWVKGHFARPNITTEDPAILAAYSSRSAPPEVGRRDHTGPGPSSMPPPAFPRMHTPEFKPAKGILKQDRTIRASGPAANPNTRASPTPARASPVAAPAATRHIFIPGDNPFYSPAVVTALHDTVNGPCMNTFESKYSKNFCPPFKGDPAEFTGWKERFVTFIHSHWPPLSEQQQLMCLLDHLQGEPAAKLKHIAMHGSNFTEACILLEERYGREDLLLMSLKATLRSLPAPDMSTSSLTQFHDTAYGLMVQLRNNGEDLGSNSLLTQDLYALLPLKLRLDVVSMQLPNRSERSMSAILACLRRHITRLDEEHLVEKFRATSVNRQVSSSFKAPVQSSGYRAPARAPARQTIHGQSFATHGVNATERLDHQGQFCPFCDENGHRAIDCQNYPTGDSRYVCCKQKKLCFTCLRPFDSTGKCKDHAKQCQHCNGSRHHAALCKAFNRKVKGQNREPRGSDKRTYPLQREQPVPRRIKPGVKKAWLARNGQRSRAQVHAAVAAEGGMAFEAEETGSQCSNESDLSMDDAFYEQLEEKDLVPLYPHQEEDPPQQEEPPHQENVHEGDPYCPDYQHTPPLRADSHGSVATTQPNGKQMAYLLECCKAQVVNPYTGKTVETTGFFDSGSNYSFVNEKLADELALPNQGPADLAVNRFGGGDPTPMHSHKRQVGIRTIDGRTVLLQAFATEQITAALDVVYVSPRDLPDLRAGKCAIYPSSQLPGVLIGRAHFLKLGHRGNPEVMPSRFEVIKTSLGPLLAGYGKVATKQSRPAMACFAQAELHGVDPLAQMAENFWHIESSGYENPKPHSDDLMVHQRLVDAIRTNEDGRYEVPLIFKTPDGAPPSNVELPTLRGLAIGRLESNVRSVSSRNPSLLQELDEQFRCQKDRDEVEVVPEDQILTSDTTVHMPHHSVIKTTSSTTKVREVYDGSAKFKGKMSLNDALHRGPVLLPPLMGMLLRARTAHIVILCDIAKAFLQIAICPQHRNLLRWFWLKNIRKPVTEDNLLLLRFKRVPFGLKISPFLLGAVLQYHFQKCPEAVASEMWRNCYVDNIMLSADSLDEALAKYNASKRICAAAQMNLREYASNSAEFNAAIPPEDKANPDKLRDLSISWHCTADEWTISLHPQEDSPLLLPP